MPALAGERKQIFMLADTAFICRVLRYGE